MKEKIALGVHTVIDWECDWDLEILFDLIEFYQINDNEIREIFPIATERELLLTSLALMKLGKGDELIPEYEEDVKTFARRFPYRVTVGGTAGRAAIALSKLGITTLLQMSTCNDTILRLLPAEIRGISAVGKKSEQIYPHVSISYPGNIRIKAAGVDFVTPRENRVLISRDIESLNLPIDPDFAKYVDNDVKAFLLSCFCEILDFEVLKDRVSKSAHMLANLPEQTKVVYEDGGYIYKEYRQYVNDQLKDYVDVVSMNEDELQDYVDTIDVMNPKQVYMAVRQVYEMLGIPTLLVHSSRWAITFGQNAQSYRSTLKSGITMAATRFQYGDYFGDKEFEEVASVKPSKENLEFCKEIEKMSPDLCCEPCKDMSYVKDPTVVGLGDFFAGGLLKDLAKL